MGQVVALLCAACLHLAFLVKTCSTEQSNHLSQTFSKRSLLRSPEWGAWLRSEGRST